jgi:hypothetical protein
MFVRWVPVEHLAHLGVGVFEAADTVGGMRVECDFEVTIVELLHELDVIWEELLLPSAISSVRLTTYV